GEWIGVELDPSFDGNYRGKNDGSVDGVRYFKCGSLAGVFVRAAAFAVIHQLIPPIPDYFDFVLPDQKEISIKTLGCANINDLRKAIIQELNECYGPNYTTEKNIHPMNIHICPAENFPGSSVEGSVSIKKFWSEYCKFDASKWYVEFQQ
ncbi:hypothetical protein HK100_008829, partial [Physocladia obscura]